MDTCRGKDVNMYVLIHSFQQKTHSFQQKMTDILLADQNNRSMNVITGEQ